MRRRVVVHGLVQMVGFRVSLARASESRGVAGWVRNRSDGTVEAVFEGAADDVNALVAWCGHGPRGAVVETVDTVTEHIEGLYGFEIR